MNALVGCKWGEGHPAAFASAVSEHLPDRAEVSAALCSQGHGNLQTNQAHSIGTPIFLSVCMHTWAGPPGRTASQPASAQTSFLGLSPSATVTQPLMAV